MAIEKTTIILCIETHAVLDGSGPDYVHVKKQDTFDDPGDDQLPQTTIYRTRYEDGGDWTSEPGWVQAIIDAVFPPI